MDHILDDVNLGAWKTSDDADIVTQQLTSVVASSENMALSMARARRRLDQKTDSTSTSTNQSISFNKTNIGIMCVWGRGDYNRDYNRDYKFNFVFVVVVVVCIFGVQSKLTIYAVK